MAMDKKNWTITFKNQEHEMFPMNYQRKRKSGEGGEEEDRRKPMEPEGHCGKEKRAGIIKRKAVLLCVRREWRDHISTAKAGRGIP